MNVIALFFALGHQAIIYCQRFYRTKIKHIIQIIWEEKKKRIPIKFSLEIFFPDKQPLVKITLNICSTCIYSQRVLPKPQQ